MKPPTHEQERTVIEDRLGTVGRRKYLGLKPIFLARRLNLTAEESPTNSKATSRHD